MKTCDTCKANKVCDHNKYGFENCGNYIPADVVAVVRCKDCIHYMPLPEQYNYSGKPAMHCAWHSRLMNENGYCDEAMRKKGK